MGSIVVIFMAIVAIFAGIYYIGSEYKVGTGFCSIALGLIILVAFGAGKFDEYINKKNQEPIQYIHTRIVHDTISYVEEVHDTVYLVAVAEPAEDIEDSIEVEIISEIPLTEDEIDSIADAAVYN